MNSSSSKKLLKSIDLHLRVGHVYNCDLPPSHLKVREMSDEGSASQWQEAHEQWKKINVAGQMSQWDEMYGLIVASKENAIGEKQRLVNTVKEFVSAYKSDPSQERVDAVLKFFRKFIGQVLERCEVAEKGFLTFYNTFSLIADPAELFLSAHTELIRQQRTLAELNATLLGLRLDNERLAALHAETESALSDLQENGDAPSALKQQLQGAQDTVAEMQSEKKMLAQMLRASELDLEKLKAESSRLRAANLTLQDALAQSTAKVDDVVSRAEKDAARLLDEAEEAFQQVELLRDEVRRLKSSGGTYAPSTLSAELAAMQQICERQKTETAELQAKLDSESARSAQLARELLEAVTRTTKAVVSSPSASPLPNSIDANPPALVEARRRVRELERDVLAQRLTLADAKEALRQSECTIEALRGELAVCSWASSTDSRRKEDVTSGFFDGTVTAPTTSRGVLTDTDFMELLDEEGTKSSKAAKLDSENTNDGEAAHPDAPKEQMLAALLAQRGILKKRLAQAEQQLATTRDEFQKIRAKNESLQADNSMLLRRIQSSDPAQRSDGFLGEQQMQMLLQERRAVGGQLHANDTTVVNVDPGGTVGDTTTRRPRRAVVSQKLFSAVDHVAVIIANMLVFNKYTRALFVGYLFSLHLVVFAVLSMSSGMYMRRPPPLPAHPLTHSLDAW